MTPGTNHAPLVYAVILTWNSGDDALPCLSSLVAQGYPRLHVLVIDNGSADGTPQRVAAGFPGLELLCLERNDGFAAANNIGIRRALAAGADYVLLLNDDTKLEPNAIALLTAAAAADPRLGIVGPAIVSWQNPEIIYLGGRIDWRTGDGLEVPATPETLAQPRVDVEYVPGCALLIKAAVIRQIGLLEESYFAYYEDVDWCLRSARAGFQCAVVPAARVHHQNTIDVHRHENLRSMYYPRRNQVLFLRRYLATGYWRAFRTSLARRLNEYGGLMDRGATGRAHSLVAGIWDGLRGVTGEQPGEPGPPPLVIRLFGLAARLQKARLRLRDFIKQRRRGARQRVRRILRPAEASLARSLPQQLPPLSGVTVIGYLGAASGMGEAARGTVHALRTAGQPTHYMDLDTSPKIGPAELPPHAGLEAASMVNLFHINAVNVLPVYRQVGARKFAGRRNVGFWYWEMPTFPARWYGAFAPFDEIWVASRYTQAAIAAVSPIPVVHMRPLVQPNAPAALGRGAFGIPDDRFVFLFSFDALSILPRKNPQAVIQTFRRAFGAPASGPQLVIKVNNSDLVAGRDEQLGLAPGYMAHLASELATVNGLLLDHRYDRATTSALMAACDCYVSLHRCEGFGLTLAEAMYFGKPCIATAYSGNLDFMTPANSYLAGYRLIELTRNWGPYEAGDHWADPDIEHAAALMHEVYAQPDAAARRGAIAAADIRREYGAAAVGQAMQRRLQLLVWQRGRTRRFRVWRAGGAV